MGEIMLESGTVQNTARSECPVHSVGMSSNKASEAAPQNALEETAPLPSVFN